MPTKKIKYEDFLRIPPQDLEAEESVLGALMLDPASIIKIADIITPSDFYKPQHQKIFEAALELYEKRGPIDILTLSSRLKEKNILEEIGGHSYLADLVNRVPTAAHIAQYAKIVKEKRTLRDLITAAFEIAQEAFGNESDIENLLDNVEQKIFGISQKSYSHQFVLLKDELIQAFERIEKLHKGEKTLRGITIGFESLDNYLSGFQRSDLIILGARPSFGKTALALDIARHAALKGHCVGLFSLEMSREQIVDRLIASQAKVPLWKLRTGRLTDEIEFEMIQEALDHLSRAPLFIDDTPSPNIMQMRTMARRLQAEHNLDLLIIDYLQLIQPRTQFESMVQQVTEISHSLKALARELTIPILAVSQLSRAVDQRETKIPRLSDLRESGSLEQDADVVLFIYRKDRDRPELPPEEQNIAEIIIAKHRNGPLGTVKLKFDQEKVSFYELEKTSESSEA